LLVDESNWHLLTGDYAGLIDYWSRMQPCVVMIDQGQLASVCFCSRLTSHAAEAGLETLPGFRRRGYARQVVAHWAQAVRQSGRQPLYSTSWENVASQGVAGKLGLVCYGEDWSLSE
jgi:hypothetical protein